MALVKIRIMSGREFANRSDEGAARANEVSGNIMNCGSRPASIREDARGVRVRISSGGIGAVQQLSEASGCL
jgi:hypothetical protein